jgi:serine/threonine protein kinase
MCVSTGSFRVKVADFGLAKSLAHSVLGVASRVGTLTYEAPEVLDGGLAVRGAARPAPHKTRICTADPFPQL